MTEDIHITENNGHTVIFGWGAFGVAVEHIAQVGDRPLILTGENSARRLGLLESLIRRLRHLGRNPLLFEGIGAEANCNQVDVVARLAMKEHCDAVVALGGGSVMDAAKAIAAVATSGIASWELTSWGRSDGRPPADFSEPLPIVCIPTITGSGSEANGTGVLYSSEAKEKSVFLDDRLQPTVAVVDPSLTATVEPSRTWAGAMDIIAHGMEDFLTHPAPSREYTHKCLHFGRLACEMAERAVRDPTDREARTVLSRLAMEVWDGTYNVQETPWVVHSMAHVVGARLGVGHGFVVARLLPALMDSTEARDPGRLAGFRLKDRAEVQWPAKGDNARDVTSLASETLRIYGENGVMPGWPGLTRRDLTYMLKAALRTPIDDHLDKLPPRPCR